MLPEFVPYPPTEEELAPFRRFFLTDEPAHPPPTTQITEEYSNSTHGILPAVITFPPTGSNKALVLVPNTTPPTTTTPSTSRFGESHLGPLPVSFIDQYGRRLLYSRGETTDDERTDTDDDLLPSSPLPQPSPPLQQFLEQQLQLAKNEVEYWSEVVNSGIQGEPERPDWLPEDWGMKCVTRTNGSSAGNRDKYYIEPGTRGRKFRSKREVLQFLETGKRRQYKRKANSTAMPSNVNRPFEGTSSSSWQSIRIASHLEAFTSQQNEETPNLDSDTVPEKQNEETLPNVDSDQNPPKRPRGSPSKSLRDWMTFGKKTRKEAITAAPQGSTSYNWN